MRLSQTDVDDMWFLEDVVEDLREVTLAPVEALFQAEDPRGMSRALLKLSGGSVDLRDHL